MSYITNPYNEITIDEEIIVSKDNLAQAIYFCNHAIYVLDKQTRELNINIFEVLGMRNLSGLVGEYFAKSIERFSNGNLHSNLHQDGYPDLLKTNTKERLDYYNSLYENIAGKIYPKDKSFFSPFKYGGIEVKATCGSTPSASIIPKPLIGEQRITKLKTFDWKAHHRNTNHLLSILWVFIDEIPAIAMCFYRNDLTADDWGKIVQPKSDGSRTTGVFIMTSSGVKKMCDGWIAVIDSEPYISVLSDKKWIGYRVK